MFIIRIVVCYIFIDLNMKIERKPYGAQCTKYKINTNTNTKSLHTQVIYISNPYIA